MEGDLLISRGEKGKENSDTICPFWQQLNDQSAVEHSGQFVCDSNLGKTFTVFY